MPRRPAALGAAALDLQAQHPPERPARRRWYGYWHDLVFGRVTARPICGTTCSRPVNGAASPPGLTRSEHTPDYRHETGRDSGCRRRSWFWAVHLAVQRSSSTSCPHRPPAARRRPVRALRFWRPGGDARRMESGPGPGVTFLLGNLDGSWQSRIEMTGYDGHERLEKGNV
jgi:hypothetical protein